MAVPFLVAWRALKGYLVPLFLLFLHFGTYFLPSVFCNQHQLPPQMSSIPFLPSPHPENISKDLSESPALAMRVSEQARTCLAPARSRAAALHLARLTRDARSCGWLRLRAAGWELHSIATATTAVHTPRFYWQPLDVPHVTPWKKNCTSGEMQNKTPPRPKGKILWGSASACVASNTSPVAICCFYRTVVTLK